MSQEPYRAADELGCGLDAIHSLQNRPLPCVVLFKVRIILWKKTPMHKLGSQIQLWLRPSGCPPAPPPPRVMSTVQPLLGRLTGEGFPTATKEPLPTTRSAPGSSPALTFICVTWMVSPTISDSNSTISDSKPPLPSNVIYCRVDVMCPHFCPCYLVLTITFIPHISRLYVGVPQKMGTDGFKTNIRAQRSLSGILIL